MNEIPEISNAREGIRDRIRRWQLSYYVEFNPHDEELLTTVHNFSQQARILIEKNNKDAHQAIAQVVGSGAGISKKSLTHFLMPYYMFKPHKLADRFKGKEPALCLDRALMGHLIFEDLGKKGSKVVSFISPDTSIYSFGLTHDGQILTLEEGRWTKVEAFQRVLQSKGKSKQLHNVYPTLSVKEILLGESP